MVYADVNGWTELMNGEIVMAAYNALNTPLGGWLIFIFYLIISLVLWSRTNSVETPTVISLIFLSSFLVTPWFNATTFGLAVIITAFELGLVIYRMMSKERNL